MATPLDETRQSKRRVDLAGRTRSFGQKYARMAYLSKRSFNEIASAASSYIARGRRIHAFLKTERKWAGASASLEIVLGPLDSGGVDVLNIAISVSAVLSETLPSASDGMV
jgi:hypothetical protein